MEIWENIKDQILTYSPKLVLAIVAVIIGFWIVGQVMKLVAKGLAYKNVEKSLAGFLKSFLSIFLKILVLITAAGIVGIEMTSFVALIGAAGLAIGLSFKDSLSNLAGGILILIFDPFYVGDYIEVAGVSGTVKSVQIFSTVLKTIDNKTVIIPNGNITKGTLINYSTESKRRLDIVFGIGYDDDLKKAKKLLETAIKNEERFITDPEPLVVVSNLGDSSVDIEMRAWCKAEDYWPLKFQMLEEIKLAFDKNGISIPYPQQDVHVHNSKK